MTTITPSTFLAKHTKHIHHYRDQYPTEDLTSTSSQELLKQYVQVFQSLQPPPMDSQEYKLSSNIRRFLNRNGDLLLKHRDLFPDTVLTPRSPLELFQQYKKTIYKARIEEKKTRKDLSKDPHNDLTSDEDF